jgi:hypothetical protein
MISLLTAFVLDHFGASMGWWWAFGIVIALDLAAIITKVNNSNY